MVVCFCGLSGGHFVLKLYEFQNVIIGMSIQMFIVIIIGLVIAFILVRGVYRFFFDKNSSRGCGSCNACEFNPENMHK